MKTYNLYYDEFSCLFGVIISKLKKPNFQYFIFANVKYVNKVC